MSKVYTGYTQPCMFWQDNQVCASKDILMAQYRHVRRLRRTLEVGSKRHSVIGKKADMVLDDNVIWLARAAAR